MEIVLVRYFYSLLEVLRNQKSQGVLDNWADEDDGYDCVMMRVEFSHHIPQIGRASCRERVSSPVED